MLRIRRFEERCVELYSAAQDPRLPPPLHRRGGRRRRASMQALDRGRRRGRDLPRARPRAGPRRARRRDHGRDVRQGRGRAAAVAAARCTSSTPRAASTAATPSSAAACRSPSAWRWPTTCRASAASPPASSARARSPRASSTSRMNLAALWQLPVLFCCENNLYAMGTALARSESETDLAAQGGRLRDAGLAGRRHGRGRGRGGGPAGGRRRSAAGGGPCFLELRTYRFRAHSMYDPELLPRQGRRSTRWKRARPDRRPSPTRLPADGQLDRRRPRRDRGRGGGRDRRRRRLRRGGHPGAGRATSPASCTARPRDASRRPPTYREAMRAALRDALHARRARLPHGRGRRPLRRLLRCQPRAARGVRARARSATRRCRSRRSSAPASAPRSAGMRPIVEIMTVNFSLLALDQIVNNAATLRHMSGGQFSVPLVIRMTTGAGRQLAAQHSHSLEGWYAHIPGHHGRSPRRRSRTPAACSGRRARTIPTRCSIFEHGGALQHRGRAGRRRRRRSDIDRAARPPRRRRRHA